MPSYITLDNLPGYLPDSEPIAHDTWESALATWRADISEAMAQLCEAQEWTVCKLEAECFKVDQLARAASECSERERAHGLWWQVGNRMYCIYQLA